MTEVSEAVPPSPAPPSPSTTSHSSRSIRAEPSVPSVHSSQTRGSGFIPSYHTSPALAQFGTSISESVPTMSNLAWNLLQLEPEISFIPDTKKDVDSSPTSGEESGEMGNVWNLVERRKIEDKCLRAEFGWGSQSVASECQMNRPLQCQNRDALLTSIECPCLSQGAKPEIEPSAHEVMVNPRARSGDNVTSHPQEFQSITTSPSKPLTGQNRIDDDDDDEDEGLSWF
jgi:hypothetical protein